MTRQVELEAESLVDHPLGLVASPAARSLKLPEVHEPETCDPPCAEPCFVIADRFVTAYPVLSDLGWLNAPLVRARPPAACRVARGVKRAADAVLAAALLVLLAPFLALVALVIRLDSPGPVFFAQDRVGASGRFFRMYKFRTMVDGAHALEADVVHHHCADPRFVKIDSDPRMTRVGCFLRKTSIDELPQLWNVLRGDMSLVGPRPSQPGEVARYDSTHFVRLLVKPGITGMWQVSGRSEIGFEEAVELDTGYVTNWSNWLDIKLLVRTVAVVFRCRGAC